MAKSLIGDLFVGVQHVAGRAGSYGRRGSRAAMGYSRGTSTAGATLAGGVAGAAVVMHERHARKAEQRRAERDSAGYAGFTEDSRREMAVAPIQRPGNPDTESPEREQQDAAAGYYLANARRAAQVKAERDGDEATAPAYVPAPWVEPEPKAKAPAPEPVPAPVTPKPEERAAEMEHGSQREQHAGVVERRGANWRSERMGQVQAQDDAAHAKAAPVVAQTFTGSDSRRSDLPG